MPPPESADAKNLRTSIQGPAGRVLSVPTGPKGVPHTATDVKVNDGHVSFRGPCLPGQSYEYRVPLDPAIKDVDAATKEAIRKAFEGRMYQ